ncbi:hypothetical protein TNCV_1452761 [Trichonephila clavipes]|nr:hypothetical protein TNCV_1452761 [Trichonephila clavipes]
MNVSSMQLPLNSFHVYEVLKVGIHLRCYFQQHSLAFWGDYTLQHLSITVLKLRSLLCFTEGTLPKFVYTAITLETVIHKIPIRLTVLNTDAPERQVPTIVLFFMSEKSDIITLCKEQNFLMQLSHYQMLH